jgi:hypothetical protein
MAISCSFHLVCSVLDDEVLYGEPSLEINVTFGIIV